MLTALNRDFFTSPAKIIDHFLNDYSARNTPLKLMVIIDEYDISANDIFSSNPRGFMSIAEGEISPSAMFCAILTSPVILNGFL